MGKTEQAEKCICVTQSDKPAPFILVRCLQSLCYGRAGSGKAAFPSLLPKGLRKDCQAGEELRA